MFSSSIHDNGHYHDDMTYQRAMCRTRTNYSSVSVISLFLKYTKLNSAYLNLAEAVIKLQMTEYTKLVIMTQIKYIFQTKQILRDFFTLHKSIRSTISQHSQ